MKKNLLALAVAGAFVAPVAMADTGNVTVYGQMNAAFNQVDPGDSSAGAQGKSTTHISSESSRVGLKGTEDLGGGLNAIWQVETGINIDDGTMQSAKRNTFVGLSGESWGSAVLGNNDSTYKTAFRGYDVFGDTIADNRALMVLDTRKANTLTYNSPDFSGVKVAVQYVAAAESATSSGQKKANDYNMAATYNAGPISAAVGYTSTKFGTAGTGSGAAVAPVTVDSKLNAFRIGGGYKMDAFTVNAIYESAKLQVAGSTDLKHNELYLAGKFAISGSDAVKVALTQRSKDKVGGTTIANTKARQMSVGFDHAMSKRTTVYALYTKLNNDNAVDYTLGTGVTTAAGTSVGDGSDPTAIAVGIKHSF